MIKIPCLYIVNLKLNFTCHIIHIFNASNKSIEPLISKSTILKHHVITIIQFISGFLHPCIPTIYSLVCLVIQRKFRFTCKVINLRTYVSKIKCMFITIIKRYIFQYSDICARFYIHKQHLLFFTIFTYFSTSCSNCCRFSNT